MNSTFIQDAATRIINENPTDLDQVFVVFNNRRSGIHMKEFFKQRNGTLFMPRIMGIDDLVEMLGDKKIIPNEFLLFELFAIHQKMNEGKPEADRKFETFEEFIQFAEMMLADFSAIDLYCVDAAGLFGNIKDLKTIGEWDVTGKPLSPQQKKYLAFYKSLYTYYTTLRERLGAKNQAYSGMAYRAVAEDIDNRADSLPCSKIYFVGFNALSKSEEAIIRAFVNRKIGSVITDGDDYYFSNPDQEAGHFLRKHSDLYDNKEDGYTEHFGEKKVIHIVDCPEKVLQTKYAGRILEQMFPKKDSNEEDAADKASATEETALVLADEGLLIPMLNALPEGVEHANVTMGFPFTSTSVHSFAEKLIALFSSQKDGKWYHKTLSDFLSDHVTSLLLQADNLHQIIVDKIAKDKMIYATKEYVLGGLLSQIPDAQEKLGWLFECEPTVDSLFNALRRLADQLRNENIFENDNKEFEAMASLAEMVVYLEGLQQEYGYFDSLSTFEKLYSRLAKRRTISFKGEPLKGLQVLGMLETRNLDFNRIVMLSVNEGQLPSGRSDNTLIPYSLKRHFGLPTYVEKDAVYAYHFYRLLQRANEVYLLFCSSSEGSNNGEPSRYIMQIRTELKSKYPNIEVVNEVLSACSTAPIEKFLPVPEKDKSVLDRLHAMADSEEKDAKKQKGLSPTALSNYIDCPLRFFYDNVLMIREQDDLNDDIGNAELGTCVHKVLENIYKEFVGQKVDPASLVQAKANVETLVNDELAKTLNNGVFGEGRNHFYSVVAQKQVKQFLDKEIEFLKNHTVEIISLELDEGFRYPIELSFDSTKDQKANTIKIYLSGKADRIDCVDHKTIRIVDYKTGRVKGEDMEANFSNLEIHSMKQKWFQVMTYAWIYYNIRKDKLAAEVKAGSMTKEEQLKKQSVPIISGIMPLGNFSLGFVGAKCDGGEELTGGKIESFEKVLRELLAELFDPEKPFEAHAPESGCKFCQWADYCSSAKITKY